jgi:hypothetical protein
VYWTIPVSMYCLFLTGGLTYKWAFWGSRVLIQVLGYFVSLGTIFSIIATAVQSFGRWQPVACPFGDSFCISHGYVPGPAAGFVWIAIGTCFAALGSWLPEQKEEKAASAATPATP